MDKDAFVRKGAYQALAAAHHKLDLPAPQAETLELLSDPSPLVLSRVLLEIRRGRFKEAWSSDVGKRVSELALHSRFHDIRCSALLALGRLGSDQVEKAAAAAILTAIDAGVLLKTGFRDKMSKRDLLKCAVIATKGDSNGLARSKIDKAWSNLEKSAENGDKRSMSRASADLMRAFAEAHHLSQIELTVTFKELTSVWAGLKRKGLLAGMPPDLCLDKKQCRTGTTCVGLRCVPLDKARKDEHAQKDVERDLSQGGEKSDTAETPGDTFSKLYQQAHIAMLKGNCEKAIVLGRKACLARSEAKAISLVGVCACRLKRRKDALWAFQKAEGSRKNAIMMLCRARGITLP